MHADPLPGQGAAENAAWVDVDLPQPAREVSGYIEDIERLLRLNPHLEIRRFEKTPQGFDIEAFNEMNGLAVSGRLTFERPLPHALLLRHDTGLKLSTEFTLEPLGAGSRLRIRETYRQPVDEAEMAQVDRSLTPWGRSLRRHFLGLARWGNLPFYRWWRERVWLGMRPRERRLARLIVWSTVIEFLVFLLALWLYV
ncbi:MAG: hypothetical protein DPW12_01265 [Rhodocyclaceae bacterium]|nr:hypothetical protein [Rhodocyclaceae bacterium]HNQ56584.1 hypothetical protein [Candidatus Desulfobacillus denitrificans]HNT62070.1 hypothetical protein [Candidatus Desulfobacillus denitrificans]